MSDGSNTYTNTSINSVRTVDSEGKAPQRRMATPDACWQSYTQARNANIKRDARFADIAGIYAGFPPTPPAVMERNGQPDMPNLNTKQFQAKVMAYVSNWMGVTAKGNGWAEVKAKHPDPMEAERRSKYLTDCFNWAIKKWDSTGFCNGAQYIYESAARDTQMGLFGIGIAFFYDHIDFRWKVIPTRRVLVPEGTRLCLDNCPAIFVEDEMSVTNLYSMRKKKGWNENAILRCLYDRVEVMSQTAQRRWTYAQWVNSLRDNDQYLISDLQPVRVIHTYTMEFDGTISHSIIIDQYNLPANKQEKDEDLKDDKYLEGARGFIYDKKNVAERWSQVWIPFADNAGPEGDYHGVKGFGDMIFDGCHELNLMFNRAAMGAVLQNTLMFKASNENDIQKLDQITINHMGLLYPGLELEQQRFQGDVDAAMALFQAGTNIIDSNTRIFPQNQRDGGEAPTATQINFDRADQAQFTTLQIDVYRAVGLDILLAEMYRRIAQPASKYPESWGGGKVAAEFRQKALEHGIPENELLEVETVRANRNGGSGNMGVDVWKADQLLSVATPGKGQRNAMKEKVAALKGWEAVPAYVEDAPEPVPEDVQIDNENLLMQKGATPQAFGFQDHRRHMESHMQLGGGLAEAVSTFDEQGVTPQNIEDALKVQNALDSVIGHGSQHVQYMAQVRRNGKEPALYEELVKVFAKNLSDLQQISQGFGEKIAQAAQQQQQVEQPSPEMMKAQQEMEINAAKAQQEMALKEQAHFAKMGNLAITTEARTEAKRMDHQLSLAQKAENEAQARQEKAITTAQDVALRTVEAQQDMKIKAQEAKVSAKKPKPKK